MSENTKDPLFEKIELLISRNNLITAEKMIKKYGDSFSKSQKKDLERKIIKQQKTKQKKAKKTLRRQKYSACWDKVLEWIKKLLVYSWFVLGVIVGPYCRMESFTLRDSWDGPPFKHNFIMECLKLLLIFLSVLYFGVKFLEEHWERKIHKDGMIKLKDRDKLGYDWYYSLEKYNAEREKNWFKGLLVALLLFIVHLVYMVKLFS